MKRRGPFVLAIAVVGAGAGWVYWHYVGCSTGSCAITSHPLNSSLYGALMGWLVADLVLPRTRKSGPSPSEPTT